MGSNFDLHVVIKSWKFCIKGETWFPSLTEKVDCSRIAAGLQGGSNPTLVAESHQHNPCNHILVTMQSWIPILDCSLMTMVIKVWLQEYTLWLQTCHVWNFVFGNMIYRLGACHLGVRTSTFSKIINKTTSFWIQTSHQCILWQLKC